MYVRKIYLVDVFGRVYVCMVSFSAGHIAPIHMYIHIMNFGSSDASSSVVQ